MRVDLTARPILICTVGYIALSSRLLLVLGNALEHGCSNARSDTRTPTWMQLPKQAMAEEAAPNFLTISSTKQVQLYKLR